MADPGLERRRRAAFQTQGGRGDHRLIGVWFSIPSLQSVSPRRTSRAPLGLLGYLAYDFDITSRCSQEAKRQMTYSIVARCADSGAFGIAVTSSSICVASRCAWVSPLGAVATQNMSDPQLAPAGLALLRQGLGAGGVLAALLAGTPEPEWRQVGVVDRYGQTALHSGKEALPTAAFATGDGCL